MLPLIALGNAPVGLLSVRAEQRDAALLGRQATLLLVLFRCVGEGLAIILAVLLATA